MMFSKTRYILILFVLILGCITVVNASDIDNNIISSDTESGQITMQETTSSIDTAEYDNDYDSITKEDNLQVNKIRKTDNELIETNMVLNYSGGNMDVGSNAIIRGYFMANNQEVAAQNIKIYDNNELIDTINTRDDYGTIAYRYTATSSGNHNVSFNFEGNSTHKATQTTVIIPVNIQIVPVVEITEDNFYDYFDSEGELNYKLLDNDTTFYLEYFPNDLDYISFSKENSNLANKTVTLTSRNGIQLNNTAVLLANNLKQITVENINFSYDNDYSYDEYITVESNVNECIIRNISLNMDKDNVSSGYLINLIGRSILENSYIKGKFVETVIGWGSSSSTPDAYGIRIRSSDCILKNNTIDITSSGHVNKSYHSLYAVNVLHHNNTLLNNTILLQNCTGYAYGVVIRTSNNTLSDNKVIVTSSVYSCGILLEMAMFKNNMIKNNYVNVTAGYGRSDWETFEVAYGLTMLDFNYMGGMYSDFGDHPYNNSFINNTIVGSAGQIYGIEIYGTGNTNLSNNNINITGRTPMGIGVIGSDITIANNNIINNGEHNHSEGTADYLEAINTGLYVFNTNKNIIMTNNTINSTNGRGIYIKASQNALVKDSTVNITGYDYAVEINKANDQTIENNIVEDNTLITTKYTGNRAVRASTNNTIENNIPEQAIIISLKINTTNFTAGQNNTIKANIYYDDEIATNITKGKVTFKVNGKTLKDANGKVIYAKVINGTAAIEDYQIPDNWNNETTIQAIYSGSGDLDKMSSEKTVITIVSREPTITIEDVTATVGGTVTLTATINTDAVVNNGKVVFKINGKLVKDANAKVIYAKVSNNQVSVEYTLPDGMKTGTYNLTAVFVSSEYDKLEDTKTLTVN
ncbi:MAG: Ig-like domain repeat protein [Methanosphaera sp.]|nr:Ig-like domain repeat protein [Methanosphaera sp.]